ncbi:hypothetical protein NKR23_g11029 [Pleurostoma richardsiae]|uniref:Helix-turn-helix domain-containing protein n=1 Tax=Pleurostoma richardsiae TaxID=41990 RepID=A0AA38RCY7_9PEZI|nr:hypothetical protein NKR23_g11029 [Pleurostoma richardsiae]
MGSGASKAAQKSARKFPARAPGAAAPPPPPRASRPLPSKKPSPEARTAKDEAVRADGLDPQMPESIDAAYASRLMQMGAVQPNPLYSPSSTASPMAPQQHVDGPAYPSPSSNPTLGALEARRRLEREAETEFEEMGRSGSQGRQLLNVGTIRSILVMRERGARPEDIEARFNLRRGVVERLGPRGLVTPLGGAVS